MRKIKAAKGLVVEEPETNTDLPDRLHWIWEAFCKLSRRRVTNETGPQPIATIEIEAQGRLSGMNNPDDIDDLEFYVDELDLIWLRKTHEKIELEREKAKRKANRR